MTRCRLCKEEIVQQGDEWVSKNRTGSIPLHICHEGLGRTVHDPEPAPEEGKR